MQVILEKNVAGIGKVGQVVTVSDGHARNFLLPQKLARLATDRAVADLRQKQVQAVSRISKEADQARSLANRLNQATITISGPTGGHDSLYGSVTTAMIVTKLAEAGHQLDEKMITLDHPIKKIGQYKIPIKLGHGQMAQVKLVVESSDG